MNRADAIALAKKSGGRFDGSHWGLKCDFDDEELTAFASAAERAGYAQGIEQAIVAIKESRPGSRKTDTVALLEGLLCNQPKTPA
jgi:hypothetical protein